MKKSISSRLERSTLLSNASVSPLEMPSKWNGRSLAVVTSTDRNKAPTTRTHVSIMAPDKARSKDNRTGTPSMEYDVSQTMTRPSPVSPGSFDCERSHSSGTSISTAVHEGESCMTPGDSNELVAGPLLPADYQPTEDDVLCGRGFKRWKGNQRYRATVNSKVEEYAAAKCKSQKSWILVGIVASVREKKNPTSGRFLRKCPETDRWYDVGDFLAKEKTSQYFRDALHDQYRSSGPSKYKRRKIEANKEGQTGHDESESGASGSARSNKKHRQSGPTLMQSSSTSQQIQQKVSTQNPSEAAVVSALRTMAFSAAPSPEIIVCALQLTMRQPNESLFEASMRVLEVTTRVAHQHNVDLFVLPELSPVGYSEDTFANLLPTTPKLIETYRQIDQAFANQARILQSYICYGTIGRKTRPDGSVGFTIRQIVLDRNGLQVASYDKIHLCDNGKCAETRFFEPGPREPVSFSIDGFRFGLLICADMRNPTLSRSLARDHNVDVLLQPAAFARDVSFRTWKSFRETRAVENSVYFIGVNYAGENFGESSVVPPWVDESHEPHVLGTAEGFLLGRIQRSELNYVRKSMPFYRQLCAERTSK